MKMNSMGEPDLRAKLHTRRVHKWAGKLYPDECELRHRSRVDRLVLERSKDVQFGRIDFRLSSAPAVR